MSITETTMTGIAKSGWDPTSLIKAFAKIVAIKAAFASVKSLVLGGKDKVEKKAAGGYTSGEGIYLAGEGNKTEWIAPNWMVNKYRNTFASLENLRVNPSAASTAAGLNSPPASGGVPAGGGGFGSVSNEVLAALANELAEFRKWKPKVYTELIKKDLDTLNEIDNKR